MSFTKSHALLSPKPTVSCLYSWTLASYSKLFTPHSRPRGAKLKQRGVDAWWCEKGGREIGTTNATSCGFSSGPSGVLYRTRIAMEHVGGTCVNMEYGTGFTTLVQHTTYPGVMQLSSYMHGCRDTSGGCIGWKYCS